MSECDGLNCLACQCADGWELWFVLLLLLLLMLWLFLVLRIWKPVPPLDSISAFTAALRITRRRHRNATLIRVEG